MQSVQVNPVTVDATLSEKSLAQDWLRPEEDAAWASLQSKPTVPGDPQAFLEGLKKRRFPEHLKRTAEEVQAQIEEERNSWD